MSTSLVTTRKPAICYGCDGPIAVGVQLVRYRTPYRGRIRQQTWHQRCYESSATGAADYLAWLRARAAGETRSYLAWSQAIKEALPDPPPATDSRAGLSAEETTRRGDG